MSKEFKRCPFCGIKRKIEVDEDDMFFVQCMKCGARTDWYLYDSDAIKAWNTRQPDKELVEALEALIGIREVQANREDESFHLSAKAFMFLWDEANAKAVDALAKHKGE